MVAYLGPRHAGFLEWSKTSTNYFDDHGEHPASATVGKRDYANQSSFLGKWKGSVDILKPLSLEELETNVQGKEKEPFLQFLRSMMRWVPEEKKTARELPDDPWLQPQFDN